MRVSVILICLDKYQDSTLKQATIVYFQNLSTHISDHLILHSIIIAAITASLNTPRINRLEQLKTLLSIPNPFNAL